MEASYDNIEQAIEENGEVMVVSSGFSMYPMLRNRKDMVVIERVNRKLKKYDVPLYRLSSGKLVLHRIIDINDSGYVIRGDNLMDKELNITDDNIVGVLKAFYRNGKYIDCEKSNKYKIYIRLNILSFPFRYLWKRIIRPFLGKIRRKLFK